MRLRTWTSNLVFVLKLISTFIGQNIKNLFHAYVKEGPFASLHIVCGCKLKTFSIYGGHKLKTL